MNSEGEILTSSEDKLIVLKDYINELFKENIGILPIILVNNDHILEITKEEVVNAIRTSKSGKALGPDEVLIELLKLIEEENNYGRSV